MSSRKRSVRLGTGTGTPYHNIFELVEDKQRIEQFADALGVSHRNIHKDDCGQWTISGDAGHLQTWHDQSSYVLCVSTRCGRSISATLIDAFGRCELPRSRLLADSATSSHLRISLAH
jgi:hypothetical protein